MLRRAAQLVVPYYVPLFAEDHAVRLADKRHSVCFFGSDTNGLRRRALHALRRVPDTMLRLADGPAGPAAAVEERSGGGGGAAAARVARKAQRKAGRRHAERRRTLASRVALRACKLCLVPAGITPSSRRFYEAIGASCVPLLLADDFEPAFTALLPPDQYSVRAAQQQPEALPELVGRALQRWPALFAGVQAARSAFGIGLGAQAARAPRCDALHAVVAELSLRFHHRVIRRQGGAT